jgi:hypothetical protein
LCCPQPAQVAFLHSLQVVWWHIDGSILRGGGDEVKVYP